ncbi:MAG TPA: sugar phosphate isomerase/epimerase family protein [Microbacteriaceae bacterium]
MRESLPYTAETWPIAAALLPFPATRGDGNRVQDAPAADWLDVFREVVDAGFSDVDLTDSWVKPGDLSLERLGELQEATREAGLRARSISAIRCSVIDAKHGEDNLAYSHRTLDAAGQLGVGVVSFGLHQALTSQQQKQLWFWTVAGHVDPPDDPDTWNLAVSRLTELGRHAAELGVLVSLEMYEDTYLGTADSAVRLVQDIGLPNVGLNPDIGNLVRLHRPVEDWREIATKTLPWSNFWHAKNYARDEDVARETYLAVPAPMESGLINYREAFQIAISAGFQGVICVEHYGGDGLSVCASNRDYLRRHVLPRRDGYSLGTSRVTQRVGV